MSHFQILVKSLLYYWRTHLAVLLGVAAGAAVIAGALIVGDSVRASLRAMSLQRLGAVDYAVSGGRFFTEDLASRIQAGADGRLTSVAPALSMQAGLTRESDGTVERAGGVSLFGLDERLWVMLEHGEASPPEAGEAILNARVAAALGAKVGDEISLNIEMPSAIPRESLLGERNDLTRELPVTVAAILSDELGASRFGLNPSQQIPPVAFVNLGDLQDALDLTATRASRRNPVAEPARINSLYFAASDKVVSKTAPLIADELTTELQQELALADLGLRIVLVPDRGYLSLESERMILGSDPIKAARAAARELEADVSPVYVYLVNELINPKAKSDFAMYSVIAGIEFSSLEHSAFGPFEYLAGGPAQSSGEVVLNEFVAQEQLHVGVGDEIVLKYYTVGSHGELPERTRTFRVSGIVKLGETAAADPHLTPALEGITDADSFSDWEQPFEMDLDRVTDADEEYWDEFRATPKAFLTLSAAQDLFRSRYGSLTSFRVAIPTGVEGEEFAAQFEQALLSKIDPQPLGLAVQPVKYQGVQAASGTTDFTGLFIGFSFFIILSAAILIGLLFRLGVEQRSREIGLYAAIGFGPRLVRRWAFLETLCVVIVGALAGTLAGIAYAKIMVYGLTTWWRGAIGTRFLFVDVQPSSLFMGFVIALVIALIAVWWGLRSLKSLTPRALLAGETTAPGLGGNRGGRSAFWMACGTIGLAIVLIAAGLFGLVPGSEAFGGFSWQVIAFFAAGMLLLTGALAALSAWLRRDREESFQTWRGLGMRNAARRRRRSVSTVALIACATFVLVAVAASRRDPSVEAPRKDSGNGGFLLLAESTTPLPYAIDTAEGRRKLGIRVANDPQASERLTEMEAISFRVRPGDDASCLNLYQTGLPTILGVPDAMIERGGFAFTSTPGEKPWQLLNMEMPPTAVEPKGEIIKLDKGQVVPTIPVIGDANTLMYSLKKGIGDRIFVPNQSNPEYALQIVGMFDGSVFQGALLMSEANFLQRYPEISGYGYFLIDAPVESEKELTALLETELTPYGFDVSSVAERIAEFLVVQNTYLSTFQTLGGLGLLLGTFGLGTVMLRNVLERRGELALMRGVGFRNSQLSGLVLVETALLLLWGLAAGTLAALLAVLPHLTSRGAEIPIVSGVLMLLAVAAAGMLSAWFAARAAARTPIVATLRGE